MSNIHPLVRINIDTANDIEKLYGIGQSLAERIVNYRNSHHYFQSPEDLAKVDGVSLQLATTISSQIDWQLPTESDKYRKREWNDVLLFAVVLVLVIMRFTSYILPKIYNDILNFQMGVPNAGIILLTRTLGTIIYFLAVYVLIIAIKASWSTSSRSRAKIVKASFNAFTISFIIILLYGTAILIDYSLNNKWQSLLIISTDTIKVATIFLGLLVLYPLPLFIWKPVLVTNLVFSRSSDIGIIITSVLGGLLMWQQPQQPIWFIILLGFLGGSVMAMSIFSIRSGKPFWIEIFKPNQIQASDENLSEWKKWINARLPDPEQQKALKKALEEMHPPSRFNTIIYAITFGAGGWLLLTSLSAVVQWFIENLLNKIFH